MSDSLTFFQNQGYCVEKNNWQPGEIESLISVSHSWESFKNKSYLSVMNPHRIDPLFFKALANPAILGKLQKIFDGPVSAVQSQLFYGPPGCYGYSLHQDNFFLQAKPEHFCSVWTSLEATSSENGGLIVYPGSHRENILPVAEVPIERRGPGQDPNSDRVESVLPEGRYQPLDLQTQAGDSVFIHANLVHASHRNRTESRFRHVLLCTYIKTGTPFRAGQYAKREEIPL